MLHSIHDQDDSTRTRPPQCKKSSVSPASSWSADAVFFFSREIAASVTHVATGRDTGILLYSDRSPISHKDHTVGSKTRECSILCPNDFFVRFGKCSHDGKEEKQGTCHGGQQPQRNRRQWHRWQRRDLQVYKDQPSKISYGKGDREEVIIKDWL